MGDRLPSHLRELLGNSISCALIAGPCRVHVLDRKLKADKADAHCCSDLFATRDRADRHEKLLKCNALLVVELPDSIAALGHGAKFAHVRQLDSLCENVRIEPDRPAIEVLPPEAEGNCVLHPLTEDEELVLISLGFHCFMAELQEDLALG